MTSLVLVSLLIGLLVLMPVDCLVQVDRTVFSWMELGTSNTRLYQQRRRRRPRSRSYNNNDEELAYWEREVRAGAQARVDVNRVNDFLDAENEEELDADQAVLFAPQWQVSLAAAAISGIAVSTVSHSLFLAVLCSGGVFYVAVMDPSDGVSGAFARMLGRQTLKSVEYSKPKIRAMARAAITNEEEISKLKKQIARLQQENYELRRWREQKLAVDNALPNYSLEELKELARENYLPVGGNKSEILMRLADAEVIKFL